MTWAEAFKKAIAATGWMLVVLVIFGVIAVVGVALGAFSALSGQHVSAGSVIAGWILMVIGYIGFIFGSLAIMLKFFSEAAADVMMKRLYPPSAPVQPQSPQQQTPQAK